MGKGLRALVVLFAICLFSFTSQAEEGKPSSIEQVYIEMPQVTVYGHNLEFEQADEQEAYLGGEKIQLSQKLKFSESGEGVYYYLLLDVSNSMPDSYFNQVKEGILQFEDVLGSQEHMVLYTFGQEVKLVLDENHNKADSADVLSGIRNSDNKTLLFEAISRAADDSRQAADTSGKRKIIMVISDGEDFATGKTMSEEALQNLKEKGIPAYAFGIEATSRENLNSFGEFSRRSGGQIDIFNEQQSAQVLLNFRDNVMNSDELRFTASSNRVPNKMETFSLNILLDNQNLTKEVMVSRWIKDSQAPEVVKTEQVSDRQIVMEFSEAVKGLELASNYTIKKGEEVIPVSGISVGNEDGNDQSRKNVVTLTVGKDLSPGDYEILCSGIHDISMEENSVLNSGIFIIDELPLWERLLEIMKNWYWLPVVLIVLVLIFLILFTYRKVKKARGVLFMDQGLVMASEVEVHKHVSIQEKVGKEFQLIASVKGNYPETLSLSLTDSFIVGRSKISNLYFDDPKMSKQHFALEWDGENMYATDLDSTNGTLVNGIRLGSRRKLGQEDVISAGSTELTIRW